MGKQTALRLYELMNAGQVEAIGDLVTEDYLEHDPLPGQGTGRDGAIDRFSLLVDALAPHFKVEDVITEGDLLAEHWHVVDQLAMLGQLGLLPAPT